MMQQHLTPLSGTPGFFQVPLPEELLKNILGWFEQLDDLLNDIQKIAEQEDEEELEDEEEEELQDEPQDESQDEPQDESQDESQDEALNEEKNDIEEMDVVKIDTTDNNKKELMAKMENITNQLEALIPGLIANQHLKQIKVIIDQEQEKYKKLKLLSFGHEKFNILFYGLEVIAVEEDAHWKQVKVKLTILTVLALLGDIVAADILIQFHTTNDKAIFLSNPQNQQIQGYPQYEVPVRTFIENLNSYNTVNPGEVFLLNIDKYAYKEFLEHQKDSVTNTETIVPKIFEVCGSQLIPIYLCLPWVFWGNELDCLTNYAFLVNKTEHDLPVHERLVKMVLEKIDDFLCMVKQLESCLLKIDKDFDIKNLILDEDFLSKLSPILNKINQTFKPLTEILSNKEDFSDETSKNIKKLALCLWDYERMVTTFYKNNNLRELEDLLTMLKNNGFFESSDNALRLGSRKL